MNTNRNYNLDLLRILACYGVVGLHSFPQDVSVYCSVTYLLCGFSVPLFFMISGYTLLSRESISYGYCAKKIAALIRIVLLWDIVKYIYYFILTFKFHNTGVWLIHNFVEDFFNGFIQEGTHWHFWYLGTLIIIYLLLPVISRVCKNNKYLIVLWAVLFLLGGTLQIISYCKGYPLQRGIKQTFRIWTALQYFLLGGIIARFKDKIKLSVKVLIPGCILVTVLWIIIQMIIINTGRNAAWAEYYYDAFIAVVWNALLAITVLRFNITEKIKSVIGFFAPLTLGVYILHPIILTFQWKYIQPTSFRRSVLQYCVLALLSTLISKLLMKFAPKLVKL